MKRTSLLRKEVRFINQNITPQNIKLTKKQKD